MSLLLNVRYTEGEKVEDLFALVSRRVTQQASGLDASPAQLDELFGAKLTPPTVRQGVVRRAEMIESARSSGRRVVGINAPAGYGKTTFLAEWAAIEDRPVAFVALDRFDDDAARLMSLLASACSRLPGIDPNVILDVTGPGTAVLSRSAPRLASALHDSETPFVLMIDDLHVLGTSDCHDVLDLVTKGIPDHSQLVAASRTQHQHLPRLRASDEIFEVSVADLAISTSGAQAIFETNGLTLSDGDATRLVEKTEGWPAGIFLSALIVKERGNNTVSITGDDPYVADYLYDEAIANLSDDVRQFLRRTSILEEMSPPLCDAVLGRSDSSQILRSLENSRLFLVSLDRRREWFRYHDLFREFLNARLRSIEPGLVEDLHVRAADWYESNGAADKAVEHLLALSSNDMRAAELIAELGLPTYHTGRVSTFSRWCEELGDAAIEAYPPLAATYAMVSAIEGRTAVAERWMTVVNSLSFDGQPRDGSASFESLRAMLRAFLGWEGPEQMIADIEFALEQEPEWSPWRDGLLSVASYAYLLAGDLDRARELAEETSRAGAERGFTDNYVTAESELALLALDHDGSKDEAQEHVDRALAAVTENRMQDYAMSTLAFAVAARVSVAQGDLEETRRLLTQGMRVRQFSTAAIPWFAVRARLQLAKVWLALADVSSARHLLREIGDILHQRPKLGILVDEVDQFREELASRNEQMPGRVPLTPAELRLLPYLQTHLTFPEIAERLFVSRNTVRTQVASIYRKLGVGSRAEAVEQATEIGLVGG